MSARVFVLLARDADVGVVFRRGPSKQVLLLRWDLKSDSFEAGQWLKARIYERRCDLSPSGERLVYFAASYRGPYQTWTAVSRPPYFTAVEARAWIGRPPAGVSVGPAVQPGVTGGRGPRLRSDRRR